MTRAKLDMIWVMLSMTVAGSLMAEAVEGTNNFNTSNGRISVFLDGPWWLDEDFIRQEIPIVNYVRDKESADVHILMTRHGAGRAGTNYAISFLGRRGFMGVNQDLTYWAASSNSGDDTRRGYTNKIKIGLVKYIAATPLIDRVIIDYDYDQEAIIRETTIEPEVDPWNSWVFEIYGGGNFSRQDKQKAYSSRFGFYSDRVTAEWKIRFRPYFNFSERTYYTDEDTIVSSSHRHGHQSYVIKSINDHWSWGIFNSSQSSTFHNMRFEFELMPALEYSLFPYDEATRRLVTFAYRMGYGYHNYEEMTIFKQDSEFLFSHSIEASARFQQTWGNFRAGITGKHFFHDWSVNRATVFANVNLRIFQGFSLNVRTNYTMINDLIAIPAGDMTVEEILLEQSQQATSYSFSGTIGLSYTFGSEFSADFNPRL